MKLVMRRFRLAELLCATNPEHAPTFQIRHELFRLARASSIATVDEFHVSLELERVAFVSHADAHIVLRPRDIQGGEAPLHVNGRRVVAV